MHPARAGSRPLRVLFCDHPRLLSNGFGELDALVLAYTMIHKSQGFKYPAVVIPVMTQHYATLQRNLLYTGITRGKKLVVLVGSQTGQRLRRSSAGSALTAFLLILLRNVVSQQQVS
jgi:hypothetical protein